jgi:hypothetical protein
MGASRQTVVPQARGFGRTNHTWQSESPIRRILAVRPVRPGRTGGLAGRVRVNRQCGHCPSRTRPITGVLVRVVEALSTVIVAAFAIDQIRGAHGESRLLHAEGYRTLHTPQAQGDLALMYPWMNHNGTVSIGYGSAYAETSQGRMTAFAGSTGTFMADCKLIPDARLGFVALVNGGWTEVGAATQEVFEHVLRRLKVGRLLVMW